MATKKCLVAFDSRTPRARSADLLVPIRDNGYPKLFGVDSGDFWRLGRVVLAGRSISADDMFARLVESGTAIDNVERALADLRAYTSMLKAQRVGSVVELRAEPDTDAGFILSKTDVRAEATPRKQLP